MEDIINNIQLISVPLKLTDIVDFTKSENNFERNEENYKKDLEKLNRIRQDIRDAGSDIIGINILYKYSEQLKNYEKYLNNYKCQVDIKFTW